MKTNLQGILALFAMLIVHNIYAQEKLVTGTVTNQDNLPLLGVTIVVDGTSDGTTTDFDGNYSINVEEGQVLLFSYIGYKTSRVTVGSSNVINVKLDSGEVLSEVVITALGVSREKQSLGYATQEVDGEDISSVQTENFTNALSGRVSGLHIRRNNNFGGSTNVVIRGNTSLTGNNQALFVVDGVPIDNRNTNAAAQATASGNSYDYGNAASDINPDDIETINVLKGAAATALYGSRAANGAIIITTKGGAAREGMGVTINSGVTFGFIDKTTFPRYQQEYGAGYGAVNGPDGDNYFNLEDMDGDGIPDLVAPFNQYGGWGAPFDEDLLVYQWSSVYPQSPNYLRPTPW